MEKTLKEQKNKIRQTTLPDNIVRPPQVSLQDWKKVRQEDKHIPYNFSQK